MNMISEKCISDRIIAKSQNSLLFRNNFDIMKAGILESENT